MTSLLQSYHDDGSSLPSRCYPSSSQSPSVAFSSHLPCSPVGAVPSPRLFQVPPGLPDALHHGTTIHPLVFSPITPL